MMRPMKPRYIALLTIPVVALCVISYGFFDVPVALFFKSHGASLAFVFGKITYLGYSAPYLAASAIVFLWAKFFRKNPALANAAAFIFLAIALSGLTNDLIKYVVGRSRPILLFNDHMYGFKHFTAGYRYNSFPSGHSNTIAALCFSVYLVTGRFRLLCILTALAVMLSRLVLGAHFPSDVIFGAYLALVMTFLLKIQFERKGIRIVPNEPEPSPVHKVV